MLDIGCGTGTQCDDLASNVKQETGIDISSKLLAIAEQRKAERKIENVEFIHTAVFDQRFEPGSFDVVTAFYVLHFFEDIDEGMKKGDVGTAVRHSRHPGMLLAGTTSILPIAVPLLIMT